MKVGQKVRLVTFNGELECSEYCDPSENYWSLISLTGTVVKNANSRGRVTVTFDEDIGSQGLHCHNETPNSLYILPSDLAAI